MVKKASWWLDPNGGYILSVNTCLCLTVDVGDFDLSVVGFPIFVSGSNYAASIFLLRLICSICL